MGYFYGVITSQGQTSFHRNVPNTYQITGCRFIYRHIASLSFNNIHFLVKPRDTGNQTQEKPQKKGKELKVLDPKSGQNLCMYSFHDFALTFKFKFGQGQHFSVLVPEL